VLPAIFFVARNKTTAKSSYIECNFCAFINIIAMPKNLLDDFSALDGHQDDTAFEVLKEHTNNGRDLIWTGRPVQGFRFGKQDLALVPFSLFWCVFVAVWETMAIVMDAGWLFILWGIPFILIGVYMLIGRFVHDRWYRKYTFYGLTANTLLIKRPRKLDQYSLDNLHQLEVVEGKNNRGTLTFRSSMATNNSKQLPMVMAMGESVDSVQNVDELYRIIRNYKKAKRSLNQPFNPDFDS
jgi:hypothetical protein